MVIDFAQLPNPAKERPTLILRNLSGNAIQPLGYAFNIKAELAYNDVSTLSFDLPSSVDGVAVPNYNEVIGMRQVDLIGKNGTPCASFMLVNPQEKDDGVRKVKSCKAYSMEYEFAKKDFFIDAGTYNFFTLGDETTIVKLILSEVPGWSIGSVSPTLIGRYRTFDEQKCKAYDFIKNQVQEKYGCIFEFDTVNREVNIIDVMEDRSNTDKRRVFLSPDRLIKDIDINEDSDKIVTALDVSGADGVTIRSVNPTGTNIIYNLDYFLNETNFPGGNGPEGIITKWNAWKAAVAAAQSDYYDTTIQYNMQLLLVMMKQAELDGLKTDLLVLENEQAVIIQAIQQKLKKQSDLDDVNHRISLKQTAINSKQTQVNDLQDVADALHANLVVVNEELAFEEWFTEVEINALQKYFFEDSIQDGTFVAETAKVYVNQDLQSSVSNANLAITDSTITDPVTQLDHTVYTCRGGSMSFSFATTTGTMSFTGYVVTANVDDDANGDTVLTAYVRNGSITDVPSDPNEDAIVTVYDSATITIAGAAGAITSSDTALSFTVTTGSFYFTENTTEYELHQIEYELYEYGTLVLQRKCNPTYNFTVNSGNFLIMDDFVSFKNQLELGRKVYLQLEKDSAPLQPYVLSVSMDYEDFGSFTIRFSSAYTSFDNSFDLADLLSQSVSMGKTLSTKGNSYELFVASGASTKVHDFMTSALDIATNAVMSTGMQAITMDDSGLRIRKWTDESHEEYDPHQIWIVDNVMAFTKDGWNTSEMALGEIFDENLMSYIPTEDSSQVQGKTYYIDNQGTVWDGTTPWSSTSLYERSYGYTITNDMSRDTSKTYYVRDEATGTFSVWNPSGSIPWSQNLYEKSLGATAYGICAPYIVGTMIAGNNLVIESEKKDGGTSVFRVDGNGASLYNANFKVKNSTTEIVIDPVLGFGIGKATASQSIINNGAWDTNKTTLWIDPSGNAHFKGNLEAATGTFNGTFSGSLSVGPIAGTSPQKYHFNVDEYGFITILNNAGNTQMSMNASTGDLSFAGNLNGATGTFKGALQVGAITGTSNYRFNVSSTGEVTIRDSNGDAQLSFVNGDLTFSGNLNAAGGTFSGNLDAAGGTFSGTISATTFSGVTITASSKIESSTITASTLESPDSTIELGGDLKVKYYNPVSQTYGLAGYLGGVYTSDSNYGVQMKSNQAGGGKVLATNSGAKISSGASEQGQVAVSNTSMSLQVTTSPGGSGKLIYFDANSSYFGPGTSAQDRAIDLGSSTGPWNNLYTTSPAINGSDRRLKHDIAYSIDDYETLFDNLRPVKFKFNDGTSNRYHMGFISQDVEAAIEDSGMTSLDFAGFIKSPQVDEDGVATGEYNYALRYGEFIALNTLKIKKLEQRIASLEAQLAQ